MSLPGISIMAANDIGTGWGFYHENNRVLAVSLDGSNVNGSLEFVFDGNLEVVHGIAADWMGNGIEIDIDIPQSFEMHQAFPNPFNPSTTIRFELSNDSNVSMVIYDIMGGEVAELVNDRMSAGCHTATWDATGLASGVYFVQLVIPEYTETQKVMLLK